MATVVRVPARVGLAGNPSDGYGGRAVAAAISGFEARVAIQADGGARFASDRESPLQCPSVQYLLADGPPGRESPHRLARACVRLFLKASLQRGWLDAPPAPGEGFDLTYTCGIPYKVGLAGSSALVVGILRALAARFEAAIPEAELPGLALAVETDEMGIHGGLMDRVIQVYGGLLHLDLATEHLLATGRGVYRTLPAEQLPALFIAWRSDLAVGSEDTHNPLLERVTRGDSGARELLEELAHLADAARDVLLSGRPADLLPIMDANFELRARLVVVGEGNRQLVETGRRQGAGVKQAGSGGAVVGAYDGDPGRGERLREAYLQIGAQFAAPRVWAAPTAASTDTGDPPQ